MAKGEDQSLGDQHTFDGGAKRVESSERSLGDQSTFGSGGASSMANLDGLTSLSKKAANANLRTQLLRILKRAGIAPWPKLFHNLRATRQTELTHEHPQHVVCRWLGNSQLIAQRHYLQVTDEDFERAAGIDLTAKDSGEHYRSKAAQNPAQHLHVSARTDSQDTSTADEKTLVLPVHAPQCTNVLGGLVGDEGLEPPTSTV